MKKLFVFILLSLCLSNFARSEIVDVVSETPTVLVPSVLRIGHSAYFVTIRNTGTSIIFWRANQIDIDLEHDIPILPGESYSGVLYGPTGQMIRIRQIAIATAPGQTSSCIVAFQ